MGAMKGIRVGALLVAAVAAAPAAAPATGRAAPAGGNPAADQGPTAGLTEAVDMTLLKPSDTKHLRFSLGAYSGSAAFERLQGLRLWGAWTSSVAWGPRAKAAVPALVRILKSTRQLPPAAAALNRIRAGG